MTKQQINFILDKMLDDIIGSYRYNDEKNVFTNNGEDYDLCLYIGTELSRYSISLNRFCKGFKGIAEAFRNRRFLENDGDILILDCSNTTFYIPYESIKLIQLQAENLHNKYYEYI